MQKKKPNESHSALSPNCKIIAITWKDERWSASLKELEGRLLVLQTFSNDKTNFSFPKC